MERNPEVTRKRIVEIAAQEIFRNGYQAMSISEVLKKAGVSKGALYHHFPAKQALGYAVFDEVFVKMQMDLWVPVFEAEDPGVAMIEVLKHAHEQMGEDIVACGCPINNIAQEMSPLDEGFRQRVKAVFADVTQRISDCLRRSQELGSMRLDFDSDQVATLVLVSIHGANSFMKCAQDNAVFAKSMEGVIAYLENLLAERPAEVV